jgi:hypothetical protein
MVGFYGPSRVDRWRALAAEALAMAAQTSDPQARAMLVSIAAGYAELATRAELSEQAIVEMQPISPEVTKADQ